MAVPNGSIDIWNFVDNVTGTTVRKWLRDSWARRKIVALQQAIAAIVVPTASTANPQMDGTAAPGVSTDYARADHVHPHDTSKQDALSTTQIAAVNSGVTAEFVTGKFAVLTGTIVAGWSAYYALPTGFTTNNCVCIGITVSSSDTQWRSGEGVSDTSDRLFITIDGSGLRLHCSVSWLGGREFKVALMRTDI